MEARGFVCHNRTMPTRASTPKQRYTNADPIRAAKSLIEQVTGEPWSVASPKHPPERQKNPAAVALSMLGASKGGKARAASLTAKQRSKIAKKAAKARWKKVA
jgi:hypothetical protein